MGVVEFLNSPQFKSELSKCVRTSVKPETWLRIVQTYIRRSEMVSPDRSISQCTPMSVMAAVLTGTQLGLEFGREAHLVPFKNKGVLECQFIADYKGLVQLARRGDPEIGIIAENVYANEPHKWTPANPNEPIHHEPRPPSQRGEHVATYCIVHKQYAILGHAWLWKEDVDKVKARSQASKSNFSPWSNPDDYMEMAKKTAFKRLSKYLSMNAEFNRAVSLDNQAETGEQQDFVDVTALVSADAPEQTRTQSVASKAAEKVQQQVANHQPPPQQPEGAGESDSPTLGDDKPAGDQAGLEAANLYLKMPAATKERLRKNFNFKSSDEFKSFPSRALDDLMHDMKEQLPPAQS